MPIGKLRFGFDPPGTVIGLLKQWSPKEYKSEGEYEKDLYAYLHDNFDGVEVVRQYGSSRSKEDLCVGRKVYIELKKDLDTTGKLQRLLGQLQLYANEKWENVILVVVGKADQNLLLQAEQGMEKLGSDFMLTGGWKLLRK
jgi:hypothetical protein